MKTFKTVLTLKCDFLCMFHFDHEVKIKKSHLPQIKTKCWLTVGQLMANNNGIVHGIVQ